MNIIQCPDTYIPENNGNTTSVFLAGGITGTGDWQSYAIEQLQELIKPFDHYLSGIHLLNPRRETFDITDPSMSDFQIMWEHEHLQLADLCLFWFTPETMCPITLYELGKWSASHRPLFVGCDPGYQRKFDVDKQTSLIRPEVRVRQKLDHVLQDVVNYLIDGTELLVQFSNHAHWDLAIKKLLDGHYAYIGELLADSEHIVIDESGAITVILRVRHPAHSYISHPIYTMSESVIDTTHRTIIKSRFPYTTFNSILEQCTRQPLPRPIYIRHPIA